MALSLLLHIIVCPGIMLPIIKKSAFRVGWAVGAMTGE